MSDYADAEEMRARGRFGALVPMLRGMITECYFAAESIDAISLSHIHPHDATDLATIAERAERVAMVARLALARHKAREAVAPVLMAAE